MFRHVGMVVALSSALATSMVLAQGMEGQRNRQQQQQQTQQQQAPARGAVGTGEMSPLVVKNEVLGKEIRNDQGLVLGTINDLVVNRDGMIQYLLIAPSKQMNVAAGKKVAIPWHAVTISQEGRYTVPLTKEKFSQAPTWDAQRQRVAGGDWDTLVYEYYGLVFVPERQLFSQLDTDQDNQISQTEAQANPRLAANFGKLDKDQSGALSPSEFSAFSEVIGQQQMGGKAGAAGSSGGASRQDSGKSPQGMSK